MVRLITAILIALLGGATIVALLVTVSLLMPGLSVRSSRIMALMPGRSFILGTVNFLFFFAVAAVLAQIGEALPGPLGGMFGLAALLLALLILSLMALGLSGLVLLLAERIGNNDPIMVRSRLGSATLLVAAGIAPVVGWFVLTPLALLASLGAAVIAVVQEAGDRVNRPVESG